MKTKTLVIIFILLFLIITVVSFTLLEPRKKQIEEPVNKEVKFGTDCNTDAECEDSLIACADGSTVSCKNGCVFGICTECIPMCAGESQCGNITCSDSVKVCSDGTTGRCTNFCNIETGSCTACNPQCTTSVNDAMNYRTQIGNYNVDAIPCSNISYAGRTEIRPAESNMTQIDLPAGYSTVIEPFSLNCNGHIDLTLSIPETYTDVRALRCKGQDCNPIVTRYVTELRCGGKISREFLREEDYLKPEYMPIKIREVALNISSKTEILSDKYSVKIQGNSENLELTLSMPLTQVEEPKNPNLKITGTPLIIKVKSLPGNSVNSIITMPYTKLEGFDEDSVGMYVKVDSGWEYIGGEISKRNRTVTSSLNNVSHFLNEDHEIMVALMEVICFSCYGSSLTKVYQPEEGSKNAVILLHGFAPKPNTYQNLIDDIKLTNQPLDVWTLDYPSSKSVNDTVKELMVLLEKNQADYDNIYVVAHSLGGLIIEKALYLSQIKNSDLLRKREPPAYNYLSKVRKVILIATPNEGSPLLDVYRNFFNNFVNDEQESLFNPNSAVMDDLVNGAIIPRVQGIKYYVIAGTKSYGFNLLSFKLSAEQLLDTYEKNDGIITVKSAQHVGDGYINNPCKDYWELNLSHTELIQHPIARRIIEKIISEDLSSKGMVGHTNYFDLSLDDCSPNDRYMIIGKEIKEQEVLDKTGCSCGNGYCGEGEDETNCPTDCAKYALSQKMIPYNLIIIFIITFSLCSLYMTYRRFHHPDIKLLVDHIKTNYDIQPCQGYTSEQLMQAFMAKGWPKWVVYRCFEKLGKEFHDTFHEPLCAHVKKHLERGYTKDQIIKRLLDSGWKPDALDKIFRGQKLEPGYKFRKRVKFQIPGEKSYFGMGR